MKIQIRFKKIKASIFLKLPKILTHSEYNILLDTIEDTLDNMDKVITHVENLKVVIDGLILNDAQHSQIESNLTRIITELRNPASKVQATKEENNDTKRSYI